MKEFKPPLARLKREVAQQSKQSAIVTFLNRDVMTDAMQSAARNEYRALCAVADAALVALNSIGFMEQQVARLRGEIARTSDWVTVEKFDREWNKHRGTYSAINAQLANLAAVRSENS